MSMKTFSLFGFCGCLFFAGIADERPIGVFDSGLGGLTVLERLLDCDMVDNRTGEKGADGVPDLASEHFVYLGDQANMPYGDYAAEGKSDLLKELVVDDANFLLGTTFHLTAQEKIPTGRKDKAKILVIACNTATAWGLEEVRKRLKAAGDETKVIGVIEAGVRATLDLLKADRTSRPFTVGVLATPGTIASGAYTKTLRIELAARGVDCEVPVFGQGCAGLADAVEACSPTADQIAVDNLRKMLEQQRASGTKAPLRAVILGCTHFPFVQSALEKALAEERAKGANIAPDCCFVDPAIYTAAECYRLLKKDGMLSRAKQTVPSAAFLSVAEPSQSTDHLTADGQLTRAFKYGRTIPERVGTTKPIPFIRGNFKDDVFTQVGRLLPRTAALLDNQKIPAVDTVPHELDALIKGGHVQGACCDESGVYLSHSMGIVKIDWKGHKIAETSGQSHIGDCAVWKDKLYAAIALRPPRSLSDGKKMPGMIGVWSAQTLAFEREQLLPENADGLVILDGVLHWGVDRWGRGGTVGNEKALIARAGLDLKTIDITEIDFGFNVLWGVQTMATDGKELLFSNYAVKGGRNPNGYSMARCTKDLKLIESSRFNASEGFGLVPKSVFPNRCKPIFFAVRALGGNMQGWRKDPVNNPPQIRLAFYEYDNGAFTDITLYPAK